MNKCTQLGEFLEYFFEEAEHVEKAKAITEGILRAHSCRLSAIARKMPGSESENYKCIQRFVAE